MVGKLDAVVDVATAFRKWVFGAADDVAPVIARGADDVAPAAVRAADDVAAEAGRFSRFLHTAPSRLQQAAVFSLIAASTQTGRIIDYATDGAGTASMVNLATNGMLYFVENGQISRENLETQVDRLVGIREYTNNTTGHLAGRVQFYLTNRENLEGAEFGPVEEYLAIHNSSGDPTLDNQLVAVGVALYDRDNIENLTARYLARGIGLDSMETDEVVANRYLATEFVNDIRESLEVAPLHDTPVTNETIRTFLENLPEDSNLVLPNRLRAGLEDIYPGLDLSGEPAAPAADVDPAVEGEGFSFDTILGPNAEGFDPSQLLTSTFWSGAAGSLGATALYTQVNNFWRDLQESAPILANLDLGTAAAATGGLMTAGFGMAALGPRAGLAMGVMIGSLVLAAKEYMQGDTRNALTTVAAGFAGASLINGSGMGVAAGTVLAGVSEAFLANEGGAPRMEIPNVSLQNIPGMPG